MIHKRILFCLIITGSTVSIQAASDWRRQQMAGPDRRSSSQRRSLAQPISSSHQRAPVRGRPGGQGRQDTAFAETMFNPHLDRTVRGR